MTPWFCIPTMSHYFQRFVKIYCLLLDFLKACQSVLIRKMRLLTFSFITNTLLDVLDKTDINITHLTLHLVYKLRPKIVADIFHFVEKPYNLRNNSVMPSQADRTVCF